VAGACEAVGRLVVAGVGESRPATAATALFGGGGAGLAAAAPSGAQPESAPPPATLRPEPPGTAATLDRDAPTEGLGIALVSIGMVLLVLTALAVQGLVGRRAAPQRWRSVLESARAARRDLGERGEVLPVLVLVVVSLAVWSAIALWVLVR
jgi:hypothetical protein